MLKSRGEREREGERDVCIGADLMPVLFFIHCIRRRTRNDTKIIESRRKS